MLPETNTNDNAEDLIYDNTNEKFHEENNFEKTIHDEENDFEKKFQDEENNLEKKIDEENNLETKLEDNSEIELISAAVSTADDPNLPCLTFRFWVLSTAFTVFGAAVSVCYFFRSNNLVYSIFFVILASYIAGKWMEKFLPTKKFRIKNWEFNLNPGPFNYKEHVCISAAANAGGVSAYAVEIISIQELFYGTKVNFLVGFLLLISTQMIGFGLAGFIRKNLVRPINMIWPKSLVFAAMFNTLHGNISETNDKVRFFYIAFISMFVWQFIPEYMFPWLASAAILCLIAPNNNTVKILGSAYKGAGILDFSLDWNAIGQVFPLFTPWWSQVNYYIGVVLAMCDAQKFPFFSSFSFDKDGNKYNQTKIIDPVTGSLNVTAYENYSPVYLSAAFAVSYCYSLMQPPAIICHVILFHGKEILERYRKTREEEEESDIHCKMMNVYSEVPYFWYGTIFIVMLIIAIILGYTSGANLPWWGVLLAVAVAAFMVLPMGIIAAITNWQLGLNILAELVCGFILPGYPIANVYFKTYGYRAMTQCLLFVQDLKLGHYMKVPPRNMFISQIWGTLVGCFVNYWTLLIIINAKRPYLDGTTTDPTGQWVGLHAQIFNTASILWGLIGPKRALGPGSMYKAKFNLVNIPVILFGLTTFPGSYPNFMITGFIASFLSQFYAFRYKHRWWKKYNYVMSAAFDSGAQIMMMVVFFCLNGVVKVPFPTWWGNDPTTQSEHCFPIKKEA
ncbi:opt family small oligopeptide transporter [Gigaspora margarita]|uniref:Opt family small oligopeptide transporter n=1 Tax=Gigaspora margarita TaxID=4874 RepID=A0A8H4ELP4_GIGMA|nr:opt family small oligopeptide transporter [Gigaspora margarita]